MADSPLVDRAAAPSAWRSSEQDAFWQGADLLGAVARTAGLSICITDREGRVMYENPAGEGRRGDSGGDPAVDGGIRDRDRLVMESGRPIVFEEEIETRRGHRTLLSTKAAWRDGAGQVIGVIRLSRDITGTRRTERALREIEQKYQSLIESTSDFIWEMDVQGRYTYCSPQLQHLWGIAPEAVLGKTPFEMVPPEHREEAVANFARVVREGLPFSGVEATSYDALDRRIDVEVSGVPFFDSEGALAGYRGVARDITSRKRDMEARSQIEARFRLLARTAERLLASADPHGLVESLCREVMEHLDCQVFFNYMIDEPSGRLRLNACAGVSEEQARRMGWLDSGIALCECVARDRRRIVAEEIQTSHDPRTALVKSLGVRAYCCHPILAQNRPLGTLSFGTRTRDHFSESDVETMRTVTDQVAMAMLRVETERAVREFSVTLEQRVAERTAQVEALVTRLRELTLDLSEAELRERRRVARVLHDHLQQILVASKLQVGILRSRVRGDLLRRSARQADDLLGEAILAARTLAVELSPPVLHESGLPAGLDWLARRMKEQHGLEVLVTAGEDADPGIDDLRGFLYEAVRELLFNVVKHAGVRKAAVDLRRDDSHIDITVEDFGRGVRGGAWAARGTTSGGLGLFSIGQRLELLGGALTFDRPDDPGTRVHLRLPVAAGGAAAVEEIAAPAAVSAAAAPSGRSEQAASCRIRVLLADDHLIVRQGFAALLRSDQAVEVVGEAADGVEAVELAQSLKPNVVVMDVSMPKMGGIDATRWITSNLPGIRVIGLSMHEEEPVALAMREAGAVAYVTKDGPSAVLMAAIHSAGIGETRRAAAE